MNISASSSMQQMQQQGPGPVGKAMTDEQRSTATAILEKYDSSSMDESSTEAMRAELKEANIAPSKDLGDMLKSEGFAMNGPKGGGKPQGPPPGGGGGPMGGVQPTEETADLYEELMEALEEEDEATVMELAKQLTGNIDASGVFVDKQG